MKRRKALEPQWTCFHCGDTLVGERAAREHFGRDESVTPACRIKAGAEGSLLTALRRLEDDLAEAQAELMEETSSIHMAMRQQYSRHFEQLQAAENLGYERGVRDVLRMSLEEQRALTDD
jgi:hypothetical protein